MFCGQDKNKGMCYRWSLNANQAAAAISDLNAIDTMAGTGTASNQQTFTGPIGGLGQFRGLTQDANADKYV